MHVAKFNEHTLAEAFGMRMAPIDTPPALHVAAAYGVVEPGGESILHRHDETELFVIVSGEGFVVGDSVRVTRVTAGDVIFVEAFDKHVVKNPGGEPLVFVDLYWRDPTLASTRSETRADDDSEVRPMFIFSTPPTPNGDLHLGHLSGPYLGADVYTRFQRMKGRSAFHLTGSDDYQSYVISKARQLQSDPQSVADRFATEIRSTLDSMDIEIHQFTMSSRAEGYQSAVQAAFERLVQSGGVTRSREPAAFDSMTGTYLYECDIGGLCPTCGAPCGGNLCEECGVPNLAFDLVEPVSKLSGETPYIGELERHTIALDRHREYLLAALRNGRAAPRLHALAEQILAKQGFRVPITHPQPWGISPREPAGPRQIIWAWPEMAFGFLFGIEALGARLDRGWRADQPDDTWKIVHFFGYDNSFYHTLLYPALYRLAFPDWSPDIDYHVNEFYLLEGLKFSTSRQHAVWGKEVLSPESVDWVRFHLSLTRGEVQRANFDHAALLQTKRDILAIWEEWLGALGMRVSREFGGTAPDAGDWSSDHRAFLATLDGHRRTIEAELAPDRFSLNNAAKALGALVESACRFSAAQCHLGESRLSSDRNRTTVALELAAALLLADTAEPLMPRFARRLRNALGVSNERTWPQAVALLRPGTRVGLRDICFFGPDTLPS
ncbi:class I tRNA ligase family protein [Burkholderia ambifaria]|uniref:class I tRNA ligase family protein n=1 Tax=Burkholderia ambifaria TaxID=152480 RepID=UPI00158F28D5|nr:class I tRNA ligase family protein [Burkholderia ambifaria]MBR8343536.1 class I tRNA ligase family protein [Burkholderia ambifaria]